MEKIFLSVLNMSMTASLLILAVLLIRLILKKAPRWIHCLLWGIVAVRLICPFSFESIFSLIPSAEPIPPEITVMEEPQITTGIQIVNSVVNPILEDHFSPDFTAGVNPMQLLMTISSEVWMIGVLGLIVYAVISYLLLYRMVKGSIPWGKGVRLCDYIETPFILGVVRPRIYVPSGLTDEQFAHVIAHEKAHLNRWDHIWKPLGFLILAVHWFNPLVWAAYILLCRDIEIACDEKVVREMEEDSAIAYAQTLLDCSQERRSVLMCPIAFGEVSVKERIKHVLNFRKPALWVMIMAMIACMVVAICFLTNPKPEDVLPIDGQQGNIEDLDRNSEALDKAEADLIKEWETAQEEEASFMENNEESEAVMPSMENNEEKEFSGSVLVYIKKLDGTTLAFDIVEWVTVPGERATELGITVDDAPNGFIEYNETEMVEELPLADNCSFKPLDWYGNYERIDVTKEEMMRILDERKGTNIPYHLMLEEQKIVEIVEQYVP